MTTVIIVPQSSTTTHEFKAVTPAGREMTIRVRASRDVADAAVLNDLRDALSSKSVASLEERDLGVLGDVGYAIGFWLVVALGGGILALILHMAGFVDAFKPFWSSGSPFWYPLFRFWVVCLPILIIFMISVSRKRRSRDVHRVPAESEPVR